MVATSYLLGVSTRRVEKLAASLGVVGLSKSQVSAMAPELELNGWTSPQMLQWYGGKNGVPGPAAATTGS